MQNFRMKVWCDWMIRQQSVWNPPPCFNDYSKIASDPWSKLASLVTLLDNIQFCGQHFCSEQKSGEFRRLYFFHLFGKLRLIQVPKD